jgi:peptide/nickel transport system substrate-binding protein
MIWPVRTLTVRTLMACLGLLVVACAPSAVPQIQPDAAPEAAVAPKRITVAIRGAPHVFYNKLIQGVPGSDAVEEFLNAGLANLDDRGEPRAQLGERVPTLENGLWQVFPDGRMQLDWTIRTGARWHDGMPFTADDLVFTAQVVLDDQLRALGDTRYRYLDRVEAVGDRGVRITWNQPFIEADLLFSKELALPIPRHVMEASFLNDRANLLDHPYWGAEFVGTGPYRIRDFVRDSHLLLDANPDYPLGRPRIDQIEVRLIPDSNTLLVNTIGGYVDLTLGRALSLDQALEARDRWREGTMRPAASFLQRVHAQMINPSPALIADADFRRALLHAIDRQEMVEVLQAGLTEVPIIFMPPGRPEFADIERNVPRYAYDPRKAGQMIESLGAVRGADGLYRAPGATAPLTVELRTTAGDDGREKMVLAIASYWQRMGVAVEPFMVPPALNQDREARANRTGFILAAGESGLSALGTLHSTQVPTAANNYAGANIPRWANPTYDDLYARYLTTIPRPERMQLVARMLELLADELPSMPIFYRVEATMISNRLRGVSIATSETSRAWNVHEWDVNM